MTNPFVAVAQLQVDMMLQWFGLWNRMLEVAVRNPGGTPVVKATPSTAHMAAAAAAAGRGRRRQSCVGPADLRDLGA